MSTLSRLRVRSARVAVLALLAASFLAGREAPAAAGLPAPAPAATFETAAGPRALAEFRGRKVMLWMLSTWCSSCAVALDALHERQAALEQAGLEIIALKNFENGGYPGPSLPAFVEQRAPSLLAAPNWTFGEVTAEMAQRYNPRRYPDVYFLIDEEGLIRAVEGAPAATMATITRFAGLD